MKIIVLCKIISGETRNHANECFGYLLTSNPYQVGQYSNEMNPAVRDYIQSKVKIWANKVDEVGRRNILKNLTETSDPWASIVQIKEDSALNCKEAFPAITFLNKLGSPTYSIHQSIFDNMENALIKEIQRFDQAKMLMMLPLTIHFLAISGLKDIPIFLIKNLSKVPEKYIHHLAKNCDLQVMNHKYLEI